MKNSQLSQHEISERLVRMEYRYKVSRIVNLACFAITLLAFAMFYLNRDKFGIVRAKGIIIEDVSGKDRILIGAPIPLSSGRVRTDTALIRKYWASKFKDPETYMSWYRGYQNQMDGIVIMNSQGFDRVLLGDRLADPNTGKRIFESAGFLVNDKQGWEKAGVGVNTTKEGKSRVAFGLDDSGGEAVHLMALEDGTKGLVISGRNGRMIIGMSSENGNWFNQKRNFSGIQYFNNLGNLVWKQEFKHAK